MIADLIATYGLPLVGALFTALAAGIARWFASHAWLRAFLDRLVVEAKAVVLETAQTYVDAIKAGRQDGVLTAEEKATARRLALDTLKSNLGAKGLRRLGRILGLTEAELDRLLGTHLEAAVKSMDLVKNPNRGATLSFPPLSSSR